MRENKIVTCSTPEAPAKRKKQHGASSSKKQKLAKCPVCLEPPEKALMCEKGFVACDQCWQRKICFDIQRGRAPQCMCKRCGDLPKFEPRFNSLVNNLCTLCYKPQKYRRCTPTVKIGCALDHSFCSECIRYHPGRKSCVDAKHASAQWNGFLKATADPGTKTGAGVAETAKAALLRIQQDGQTDEWFRKEFASQSDDHGIKFCPNPKCKKIIYKVDRCTSMICGKNNDDDEDNQDGCRQKFDWRKAPHATKEEIDAYLSKRGKKTFAQVELTSDGVHYSTAIFHSKDLKWETRACTECSEVIKGTRFDCINCGGDSGRPSATLCLKCVTNHVDHRWGKTKHSGHKFAVVNPLTTAPVPALRYVQARLNQESGILSVRDLSRAVDLVELLDTASDKNLEDGSLVTVRVDLHPDGNLVFADNARRAIGDLCLDSIAFDLNDNKTCGGDKQPLKLLDSAPFYCETDEPQKVNVEAAHLSESIVFHPGAHYRFNFSVHNVEGLSKYMTLSEDSKSIELPLKSKVPLTDDLAKLVAKEALTEEQAHAMMPPQKVKGEESKGTTESSGEECATNASVWEVVNVTLESVTSKVFMLRNVLHPELFLRSSDRLDNQSKNALVGCNDGTDRRGIFASGKIQMKTPIYVETVREANESSPKAFLSGIDDIALAKVHCTPAEDSVHLMPVLWEKKCLALCTPAFPACDEQLEVLQLNGEAYKLGSSGM
eukprot:g5040.t1